MIAIRIIRMVVAAVGVIRTLIAVRIIRMMVAIVTAIPTVVCATVHSPVDARDTEWSEGATYSGLAVSRDNRTSLAGDQCTEMGTAHNSRAPTSVLTMLRFFRVAFSRQATYFISDAANLHFDLDQQNIGNAPQQARCKKKPQARCALGVTQSLLNSGFFDQAAGCRGMGTARLGPVPSELRAGSCKNNAVLLIYFCCVF
jgi:hypothetical protein